MTTRQTRFTPSLAWVYPTASGYKSLFNCGLGEGESSPCAQQKSVLIENASSDADRLISAMKAFTLDSKKEL